MSINTTIFLALLLFLILQETLPNHPTIQKNPKETKEKTLERKPIISTEKREQLEKVNQYQLEKMNQYQLEKIKRYQLEKMNRYQLEKMNRYRWDNGDIKIFFHQDGNLGFHINVVFTNGSLNKDIFGKDKINALDQRFNKMTTAIFCRELIQNLAKKQKYTFHVSFEMEDGQILKKITENDLKCSWKAHNYIDLTKIKSLSEAPQYRIPPKITNFNANELSQENRYLTLELLVNEDGDVEQVGYPSIYLSDESNKDFQKLKPIFLNAKFYPYVQYGFSKSFLTHQRITIDSAKKTVSYDALDIFSALE